MKSIQAGRYLLGIELVGETTTKMLFVPMGARNIPKWDQAVALNEEDFQAFMSERTRKGHEQRERAEQARKQPK